jgi:hypothetical protein
VAAASALSGGRLLQDETHTADGKPKEDVFSIIVLLFSVNDYRPLNETQFAMWDTFWHELDFEIGTTPHLDFGKAMKLVNFNERWVYRGSLTVPPCT